jgi:hypothetical protein
VFLIFTDSCPVNSYLQRNYTDCGVTCQNRTGTTNCSFISVGCVCNVGYFRGTISGPCIRECDCGCLDSTAGYHPVLCLFLFYKNKIFLNSWTKYGMVLVLHIYVILEVLLIQLVLFVTLVSGKLKYIDKSFVLCLPRCYSYST